ncbi:unnamed protein product [Cunninghamella blakesleeana]
MSNKRVSFANFPIPFDHPYTLPTLVTITAASAIVYYSLQASYNAEMVEALRKQQMKKRKRLTRPEDKYASLQIESAFVNPFESWEEPSLQELFLYWIKRNWHKSFIYKKNFNREYPIHQPDFDQIFPKKTINESWIEVKEENTKKNISFTWLGQSTCLVTLGDITILTDPIFNDTSNTLKRISSSPCLLSDIQQHIDIVLISHDHADHLDKQVVHKLGNSVTWYVPLGLRDWFTKQNIENVIEMDWWQEVRHKESPEIIIACVPSMHSSGGWVFNRNQSLWCGFVIKNQLESFLFCGASGYDKDLFKAIGKVYSPLTLAALPIGGYRPKNIFSSLNMDPTQTIRAHHDLKLPRLTVGIHWGTLNAEEPFMEPSRKLEKNLIRDNIFSTLSSISTSKINSTTTTSTSASALIVDPALEINHSDKSSPSSSSISITASSSPSPNSSCITSPMGKSIFIS